MCGHRGIRGAWDKRGYTNEGSRSVRVLDRLPKLSATKSDMVWLGGCCTNVCGLEIRVFQIIEEELVLLFCAFLGWRHLKQHTGLTSAAYVAVSSRHSEIEDLFLVNPDIFFRRGGHTAIMMIQAVLILWRRL